MPDLKGKKILIVDDEPDLRDIIRDEFKSLDCEVFEAENGRQAFEILTKTPVDAIVSDVRMANGNGIELLEKVKKLNSKYPIVVLITGFADMTIEQAYDMGADAIFSKPFNVTELINAVERALTPIEQKFDRRFERLPVQGLVSLRLKGLGIGSAARTVNIGRGGAFIASDQTLPSVNDHVEFRIEFDNKDLHPIEGTGLCRWVREKQDQNSPKGFGIEFLQLAKESSHTLQMLIDANSPIAHIPKD